MFYCRIYEPIFRNEFRVCIATLHLDDLFSVYPTIPNGIREIDQTTWEKVQSAYEAKDNFALVNAMLKLKLFPIKDSYVAYMKRDNSSVKRNPRTVNRIASQIMQMNLDDLYKRCSEPKETNRQIGPMFKKWVNTGVLGFPLKEIKDFAKNDEDAILVASDAEMKYFAEERLSYTHDKGLDFLARIRGKYIIGEAKFLTDFGGHQDAQFNDAMATLNCHANAIKIAILDGVLYINGRSKMHKGIMDEYKNSNIMSALILSTFLNTI